MSGLPVKSGIWRSASLGLLLLPALYLSACGTTPPYYLLEGDRFVLHSTRPQAPIHKLKPVVDQIMAHYRSLFRLEASEIDALQIFIDRQDVPFESEEYPAVYRGATNSIHFRRRPDRMLLLHEIAHHFIRIRLGDVPVWLNEGLATYLGWSAMDEERIVIGEIPVTHYKTLKKMSREGNLLSIDDLMDLEPETFYDPERNTLNYSQAWGFVFFLFHGALSQRLSFSDKLDRAARMDRQELAALEEPFQRFCRNFSASQMMKERLASGMDMRRLSNAYRLGLLQDEGAVEDLLDLALDRSKEAGLRIVALYACAMIAVGTDHWRVQQRLHDTLQRLQVQKVPEIREAAFSVGDALRRGDREAIAAQYGALCRGCAFYPAGRFLVIERESGLDGESL